MSHMGTWSGGDRGQPNKDRRGGRVVILVAAVGVSVIALVAWQSRTTRAVSRAASESALEPFDYRGHTERDNCNQNGPRPVHLDSVDRECDLHGVVVRRKDGVPVAGAELRVVAYPWQSTPLTTHEGDGATCQTGTTSAEDGTFSLRLQPGHEVALRVRAVGYAALEVAQLQAGERIRIEMERGVRLAVLTCNENGDPVVGTGLRVWRAGAPVAVGVTDKSGRCVFAALPGSAVCQLEVVPERLAYAGWESVRLPESGEHEHVVTLTEGRTITGSVRDAHTGAPIANARVGMTKASVHFVLTDVEGHYELSGWSAGAREIHCVAESYGRAQWTVTGDRHDFNLERGDSVTGRLLGTGGRPIDGAATTAVGRVRRGDEEPQICTRDGRSDREGRFLLSGLRRDIPHTLIVIADGYGRYLLDFDANPNEAGTIDLGDIPLPEARTIAGRVLSHTRDPLVGVDVSLTGHNPDRGRLRGAEPDRRSFCGTADVRRTDDIGRFRFGDLSPGRYTLCVRRLGMPGEERDITLLEQDLLGIEFVLPNTRPFTVTVVDEDGAPILGVSVNISTTNVSGQTDAAGRAVFEVAEKVTHVAAHPFGRRDLLPTEATVEGSDDTVRLVLRRAAALTGIILADGNPLGPAWVAARRDGKRIAWAQAGADGRFSLTLPAGEAVRLEFVRVTEPRSGGEDDYEGSVEVAAGAEGVELRVRRVAGERALRVKVVFPDGAPVAGVTISVGGDCETTGADGVALFEGLSAREVAVNVTGPADRHDVVPPRATSLTPAGQEVVFFLRPALTISGVVLMPNGTAAAGATVQIRANQIRYNTGADREGRFTASVALDEAGPWTVYAELRDAGLAGELRNVQAGTSGLQVRLQ